ncbi:MAG: hypothetical protein ACLQVY_09825 [Limisphaerales bacterium]
MTTFGWRHKADVRQTHLPHLLGFRLGDVIPEAPSVLSPHKTEPLADIGPLGQTVEPARRNAALGLGQAARARKGQETSSHARGGPAHELTAAQWFYFGV